jgi:hypothetical protein
LAFQSEISNHKSEMSIPYFWPPPHQKKKITLPEPSTHYI